MLMKPLVRHLASYPDIYQVNVTCAEVPDLTTPPTPPTPPPPPAPPAGGAFALPFPAAIIFHQWLHLAPASVSCDAHGAPEENLPNHRICQPLCRWRSVISQHQEKLRIGRDCCLVKGAFLNKRACSRPHQMFSHLPPVHVHTQAAELLSIDLVFQAMCGLADAHGLQQFGRCGQGLAGGCAPHAIPC